jgi:hypothetical protein
MVLTMAKIPTLANIGALTLYGRVKGGRVDHLDRSMVLDEGSFIPSLATEARTADFGRIFEKKPEVLCRKLLQIDPETSDRDISRTVKGIATKLFQMFDVSPVPKVRGGSGGGGGAQPPPPTCDMSPPTSEVSSPTR